MKKIGLIAGNGKFPLIFAKAAKEKKVKLIACAIEGETNPALEKEVAKFQWISLGELEKLSSFFKENGIKEAVMAGQVRLARLLNEKIDFDNSSRSILKNAPDFRGDTLMEAIGSWLDTQGIKLIPSSSYLEHLLAEEGALTRAEPTVHDLGDIELGKTLARTVADKKIGQTVVVKNGIILAVEAIEGTDAAIKRGVELGNKDVIVVKMAREGHDMKFDLPVIGIKTLEVLKLGVKVLAIEAGKTIVFDKEELIKGANEAGIAIIAI